MTNDPLQLSLFVPDDVETSAAVEARRLRPFQQDWTPEALSREFVLSSADLAQVRVCRGAQNRLGFALHLALLRFLHVVRPSFDVVPEPIVHFISLQLDVNPAVLASYATRAQTRDDHLAQIRTYLGVRPYTATDTDALLAYLIQRALHHDDRGVLIADAEAWLRRAQILFPALSTLQRFVTQARSMAEESLQQTIMEQLDATQLAALDALLDRSPGRRGSTLAWLKEAAPHASVPAILALLRKRATMHALHVLQVDVSALNRNRVRQFAQLGRLYYAATLRRFSAAKRATLLVCVCHDLDQQITDDIVEMLDVLIGRIFRTAEHDRDALFAQQGKAINAHLHLFRTVASIVLDQRVSDDHIRPLTFTAIPEAQLQQEVADSAALVQPQDFNVFAFLAPKYGHLRTFLSAVVQALPFTGTAAARPVLDALAFLRQLDTTKPKWRKLPPDTPLAFVEDRWYGAVCPADETIDHRMWLLCLAEQIRRRLRSSDLLIPGSRQHRAWDSYVHPPATWAHRRPSWFMMWHGPPDVDAYLQQLTARYETTVQHVAATWPTNPFARIEAGRLALTRDEKLPISDSAKALRTALVALLPRVSLPTLLIEVESWVHFRQHFTHPNAAVGRRWAVRDPALDVTLFAVILAHGCNLTLSTMAEAASLPYHHLVHTADWYVRDATIRQAIIALIDYHHRLPLAATFGAGTSAMSDGIRFGVTARSLYARHNPRLPTRTRGVTVYDMTSDQGSQPYIDVIRCDIRESAAVLDAALHHETELPLTEHFTDTHGYTELMFGLFELESRIFSPRIRDLATQVLYPLHAHHRQGPLGALFRGPRIRPERIRANWDEMHRIAASLQDGTVTAQLLVSKLQALKQQHGAHTGIQELGRIFKTLAALTYIRGMATIREVLSHLTITIHP